MKRLSFLILIFAILLTTVSCTDGNGGISAENAGHEGPSDPAVSLDGCHTDTFPVACEETDYVQFTMVGGATFVVQLMSDYAPLTVQNFKDLVSSGFYNGLTFHRIVEGSMIQGGDPNGNGTGSAEDRIQGEFALNGYTQNTLKHERGVLSMVRSGSNDSASCQFCILLDDKPAMDGVFAAFGRVVVGMETIDAISALEVTSQPLSGELTRPKKAPVIESAVFVEYGT
jgi:peptidylprolyl isomerase/peptidyl-prolyl cis-trans isomerase B (cyclophilin B)